MDPQALTNFEVEDSLTRLDWIPRPLDLVEIQVSKSTEPVYTCNSIGTDSPTLRSWLKDNVAISNGVELTGRLSLIIESSQQAPEQAQAEPHQFREELEMLAYTYRLPFSKADFRYILKSFDLPMATPQVICERVSHFQQYRIRSDKQGATVLGFTLRIPTKGVLWLDASLSISYSPSKGTVRALLHNCTRQQRNNLRKQLKACAWITGHPLLIAVLLVAVKQRLIYDQEQQLWAGLVHVETKSGLTGAPAIRANVAQAGSISEDNINLVTREALGIVQLATYANTHAKALLVVIQSMQRSMEEISNVASSVNKSYIHEAGLILSEQLASIEGKTKVLIGDLEFIEKRAQVQITAVYNFLTQSDARISQGIAEDSRRMAADSGQIARASKRDSSAMKGLAVLTMFFLPGTFLASFFSMPFFVPSSGGNNNNNITVSSTPIHLRIFWAVTIPLTIVVLVIYVVYLIYVTHRDKVEDRTALLSSKPPPGE